MYIMVQGADRRVDKATRVLNLFIRLVNGETVRKTDLSDFGHVGAKSIQRDINTINHFFYESEYWNNKNTKVVYKRSIDGYRLINSSYSQSSLALMGLMIKMISLTPILHIDIYKLFLREIDNNRIEDRRILMDVLNRFQIRKEALPGINMMNIHKALLTKKTMWMKLNDRNIEVKPLSTMYMHFDYWFTYEYNKEIYTEKMRNISNLKITENTIGATQQQGIVIFEVDNSIWDKFRQQFAIREIIKRTNNDTVIAYVSCTERDAFYASYQLAPLARMLGPQIYIDRFIDRLDTIKNSYVS